MFKTRLKLIYYLNKLNAIEILLLLLLIWATLWPIVFPNSYWRSFQFKQISDNNIANDLSFCQSFSHQNNNQNNNNNNQNNNKANCPLFAPNLGLLLITISLLITYNLLIDLYFDQ
jgi:hypothetical protein